MYLFLFPNSSGLLRRSGVVIFWGPLLLLFLFITRFYEIREKIKQQMRSHISRILDSVLILCQLKQMVVIF